MILGALYGGAPSNIYHMTIKEQLQNTKTDHKIYVTDNKTMRYQQC